MILNQIHFPSIIFFLKCNTFSTNVYKCIRNIGTKRYPFVYIECTSTTHNKGIPFSQNYSQYFDEISKWRTILVLTGLWAVVRGCNQLTNINIILYMTFKCIIQILNPNNLIFVKDTAITQTSQSEWPQHDAAIHELYGLSDSGQRLLCLNFTGLVIAVRSCYH